ncbi:hypothetical protein [Actinacidiphila reveromycinica]|nr:hypothetical protein [Streptomyces sp. SN-593]
MNPNFQLATIDGTTFTQGDTNPFPLGAPTSLLESIDADGDFVVLEYQGGLIVSIPEHQVRYVLEIEPTDTSREDASTI